MNRYTRPNERDIGALVARASLVGVFAAMTACSPAPTSVDAPPVAQAPETSAPPVPKSPSGPPTLAMTYGEPTSATTDDLISLPITVRVYLGPQKPAVGVTVRFAMKSGSGSVNPTEAVTNAQGEARTTLTYPYDELNVVEATTPLGGTTTIMVGSYRNHEGIIRSVKGPFLEIPRGAARVTPVTVRVVGRDGKTPLASRTVRYAVQFGGGTLSAATAVTNEAGEATITWTLGNAQMVNRLLVTGDRLMPVMIHAIAP